jgi:hypothetical protein
MELRDWVQNRFGGTGETLLDESMYSNKELRKDVMKLEHALKKLENEMDKHGRKYKQILKEGSDASELERKKFAQKAKFEKKKYAVKKKKHRARSIKLGTLLSIQGMREIVEMQDNQNSQDLAIDDVLEDADAQEVQGEIMDQMASFNLEMEDLQEIQGALDVPIMDQELEMDHSEEEQIMSDMAASDISNEEVDIDSDLEAESEGIDIESGSLDEEIDIGSQMEM